MTINCSVCGQITNRPRRGMCNTCYMREYRTGSLDVTKVTEVVRDNADLIRGWLIDQLRAEGWTVIDPSDDEPIYVAD
jgi:hypothetical protein